MYNFIYFTQSVKIHTLKKRNFELENKYKLMIEK